MDASAPAIFVALEQSAAAQFIRQSSVVYPLANVAHVVTLALYATSVALIDLRLLGLVSAREAAYPFLFRARRIAQALFAVMVASGLVLFTAEASHLVSNPVFLAKMALVSVALLNAVVMGGSAERAAVHMAAGEIFAARYRGAALLSLAVWLAVIGAGRLIAYV